MAKLGTSKEYSMYYGGFRGVDFSNDHTQINDQRLAYAVNMYKDYYSEQGKAIETIAGFRRRFQLPESAEIYGIHTFRKTDEEGTIHKYVLIHGGKRLYLWKDYPETVNVIHHKTVLVSDGDGTTVTADINFKVSKIVKAITFDGDAVDTSIDKENQRLTIISSTLKIGDAVDIAYLENEITDAIYAEMNEHKSVSFVFNNRIYILDGKNYLWFDGEIHSVTDTAYIPTTYINISVGNSGENGEEYEVANLLQPKFKHTYVADGENKELYLNETNVTDVVSVKVYGVELEELDGYDLEKVDGMVTKIILNETPPKPEEKHYPEQYAGIEVIAERGRNQNQILESTVFTIFDDRVFVSGNPKNHNAVYWCSINSITGYIDPSYFPINHYVTAGTGDAPVTGMIAFADTLAVLKSDTQQDGSVYYCSPVSTSDDLYPRMYKITKGLSGIGCLGSCINFYDDPVFISRLGVEAIGQLSARYERAIEHRSEMVDAKLVNMNLSEAVLEKWNGYLVVLIDGQIFLADSRQVYTDKSGNHEYEWYYLSDIGIYENQYTEYRYAGDVHAVFNTLKICPECQNTECECESEKIPLTQAPSELVGTVANASADDVIYSATVEVEIDGVSYKTRIDYKVVPVFNEFGTITGHKGYYCYTDSNYTGGEFKAACCAKNIDDNLFFGTKNGVVCSFNFDKRGEDGKISSEWYSFDDRAILCGCATKLDNCGIPHLTKSTIKKSTVIKTKTLPKSAAKIKVRTNRKAYNQIARINSAVFSFDDMDFADFTFETSEQSLFSVKEAEKKWIEKQYYIFSDEYMKPFALYYVAYRYKIAGRYKE